MAGEATVHLSIDSILSKNSDEALHFNTEFLNSLHLSSMLPHILKFKMGCLLLLLKNLNPAAGLCHGCTHVEILNEVIKDNKHSSQDSTWQVLKVHFLFKLFVVNFRLD